jgi:serine palmitoyltransferase
MGHGEKESSRGFTYVTTYLGFAILSLFGHFRDFFGKLFGAGRYFGPTGAPTAKGYAPLLQDWEHFFTRRLYHRIQDCWNRPIAGPPYSNRLPVLLRTSDNGNKTMRLVTADSSSSAEKQEGEPQHSVQECINLGSYNYLGFADDWGRTCREGVLKTQDAFPTSLCTSSAEGGYTTLHRDLEALVASFVGKEAACVFNMGWATNALGLPALFGGKGTLIVSDSLNHNSIVAGARTSGAVVRVFRHNDSLSLQKLLRAAIRDGQERTHRPWRRILVAIEGIYSMEGEFCKLAEIVRVAKAHKAYVYLDEAHSIGATGLTGRGVCEHTGVDPRDVDVLMGTFTKSFGAMGGYIAADKATVALIRRRSAGFLTDNAMAPGVAQQVFSAFKVMLGRDGTKIGAEKLSALRDNANYFRKRLVDMGCDILGEPDSPVIPMLIYNPTKLAAFSRMCLERGVRCCWAEPLLPLSLRGAGGRGVCAFTFFCCHLPLLSPPYHITPPLPPSPPLTRTTACGGCCWLPCNAPAHLPGALLCVCGAHTREPRQGPGDFRGGCRCAQAAL